MQQLCACVSLVAPLHAPAELKGRDDIPLLLGCKKWFLCTGAFLYIRLSFLLINNMFCGLSLLHWSLFRVVKRCGGGGSVVRKIYCIGPWKLAPIVLYNPLKSPMGAHVHKTTYGPPTPTSPCNDLPASKELRPGPYKYKSKIAKSALNGICLPMLLTDWLLVEVALLFIGLTQISLTKYGFNHPPVRNRTRWIFSPPRIPQLRIRRMFSLPVATSRRWQS